MNKLEKKRMWGWFFVTALYMTESGWVHSIFAISNEGTPMACIHWVFLQENSPVNRKAAYLLLYCVGREARQITFVWGEISSFIIWTLEWFCLSAFSFHYFRLVSFVQTEKLHICHCNAVVIGTPCEKYRLSPGIFPTGFNRVRGPANLFPADTQKILQ